LSRLEGVEVRVGGGGAELGLLMESELVVVVVVEVVVGSNFLKAEERLDLVVVRLVESESGFLFLSLTLRFAASITHCLCFSSFSVILILLYG
jgi:hypothetical protein